MGNYHFFKGQEAPEILTLFFIKHPHMEHCIFGFITSGQDLHIANRDLDVCSSSSLNPLAAHLSIVDAKEVIRLVNDMFLSTENMTTKNDITESITLFTLYLRVERSISINLPLNSKNFFL